MDVDGLVGVEEAARLLGVSTRRVSQLAGRGEIARPVRGLYDVVSIYKYLARRQGTHTRAWEATTAWAAIAILSGWRDEVTWLPERSLYRLDAALRVITAAELVAKTRNRAAVHVFEGHAFVIRHLQPEVVTRDWRALGLAGSVSDDLDGYVDSTILDATVHRYGLRAAASGSITLRATSIGLGIVRSLAEASDVLIALDAAESIDPRAGGVGERAVARALAQRR